MKTHRSDKYFETSNFYLSAFLFAKGFELVKIKRTLTQRCEFVFDDKPEITNLAEQFFYAKENSKEILVDARLIVTAIRNLKDRLYQEQR